MTTAEIETEDEYRPCECPISTCYCAHSRDTQGWACFDCREGSHLDRAGNEFRREI